MNLIGHNYITYKILGHISPYTVLGSHIPDLVPFLPSSVFTFKEIHESQDNFLQFVKKNFPEAIDLPLSMMCHSVKHGVDEYNKKIDKWLLEGKADLKEQIAKMISEASEINYEKARGPRLHNYLWGGVDIHIIKTNPDKITYKLAKSLKQINYKKTAKILGLYYKKELSKVEDNLVEHFKPIKPETFTDEKEYIIFYNKFLSRLPEKDNLDVKKGLSLANFIYDEFKTEWGKIIVQVESKCHKEMSPYLENN